ncbi:hypothetical protein Golob_007781 [Gossypium lobatum]|uniref:Uncharacterized protein n=1 Tax=Gossypium lobatum TaxID=34289 RepID=A0A7J8MDF5_9ROSI|nr:hypothetical protein [Gossypium lobatum]
MWKEIPSLKARFPSTSTAVKVWGLPGFSVKVLFLVCLLL